MIKLYIAGPMSGLPEFNYPTFNAAADKLRSHGFKVFNPTENGLPSDAPWKSHMIRDIAMLMRCDGVVLLDGWNESKGAKLEHHIAQQLGIPCFTLIGVQFDPSIVAKRLCV